MNTFRRCILVCGLTLAVASVAFAQSAAQSGTNKMVSCCCACSGDSCDMTKTMKNHVMSADKHDCCCSCCGDSCDMKKKDAMKNHADSSDKHDCCGESCDMKKKDAMKNHVNSSDKHECCCSGDSCDMKNMKDTKKS